MKETMHDPNENGSGKKRNGVKSLMNGNHGREVNAEIQSKNIFFLCAMCIVQSNYNYHINSDNEITINLLSRSQL